MTEGYWKLFCLSLIVDSVGVMVMTPGWESVGCEFKYSRGIFSFLEEKCSLISLILNTKSGYSNSLHLFINVFFNVVYIQGRIRISE